MPRTLKTAVIQMNAEPVPTSDRLHRAEILIAAAAAVGAQILVLPEVFNTGYVYSEKNYQRAESINGQTITWMKATTQRYNVYLVGSLLLRENDEIYNAQILVSPQGEHWRYDKTYPWAWERAYFRGGRGPLVADTPLGRFGLLICWDAAHPHLWASYAGKVDAMLVSSCPPLVGKGTFVMPDGKKITTAEMGAAMQLVYRGTENIFGALMRQQAAWLGVPLVATTTCGTFSSSLPRPKFSMAMLFAMRPDLWKYLPDAKKLRVECGYYNDSYIATANGQVLAQVPTDSEGFVISEVTLADAPPQAKGQQPAFGLHPMIYSIDSVMDVFLGSTYRTHAKQG